MLGLKKEKLATVADPLVDLMPLSADPEYQRLQARRDGLLRERAEIEAELRSRPRPERRQSSVEIEAQAMLDGTAPTCDELEEWQQEQHRSAVLLEVISRLENQINQYVARRSAEVCAQLDAHHRVTVIEPALAALRTWQASVEADETFRDRLAALGFLPGHLGEERLRVMFGRSLLLAATMAERLEARLAEKDKAPRPVAPPAVVAAPPPAKKAPERVSMLVDGDPESKTWIEMPVSKKKETA